MYTKGDMRKIYLFILKDVVILFIPNEPKVNFDDEGLQDHSFLNIEANKEHIQKNQWVILENCTIVEAW